MPWQLPDDVAERVQRARRLLAESEAHAGSADLQHFLESAALSEQMHQLWLHEDGSERRNLGAHQKQQGQVLYLLWSLNRLQDLPHVPELELVCELAAFRAADEWLTSSSKRARRNEHGRLLLSWLTMSAATAMDGQVDARDFDEARWQLQQGPLSSWDADMDAALQWHQQQQGFQPAISTAQLRQLHLLLRCAVRGGLASHEPEGSAACRALMAEQAADYAQLCQLVPRSPVFAVERAVALWKAEQPAEALTASAAALSTAKATNSSLCFCKAAIVAGLLTLHDSCQPVPALRVIRVHGVVATAMQRLELLQEFVPADQSEAFRDALEDVNDQLSLAQHVEGQPGSSAQLAVRQPAEPAVAHPASELRLSSTALAQGAALLDTAQHQPAAPARPTRQLLGPQPAEPAVEAVELPQPPPAAERCSLCGEAVAAPAPARCARCHTTVYCSRSCQGRHWLGGHREECTRIVTQRFNAGLAAAAAARGGGAGGMLSAAAASAAAPSAPSAAAVRSSGTPDIDEDAVWDCPEVERSA